MNDTTLKICLYPLSLGLILLYACDPELNVNKIIKNSSEYDVILIVENPAGLSPMTSPDSIVSEPQKKTYFFNIPSKSEKTISFYSIIGTVDKVKDCEIKADLLKFDTTTYRITRGVTDANNWNKISNRKNRSGGGDVTCTFELKSGDVIRK